MVKRKKLFNPKKPKRFAETVKSFREDIGLITAVRGTAREFSRKLRPFPESIHSYRVNPFFDLSDREFFSRFRASINAAVSRAFLHAHLNPSLFFTNPRKVPAKALPSIVFYYFTDVPPSGKKPSIQRERKIHRLIGVQSFKPRREVYEKALVHGREKPTFAESEPRREDIVPYLFVDLTKKEFLQVYNEVNLTLKRKYGLTLRDLFILGKLSLSSASREKNKVKAMKWKIVLKELMEIALEELKLKKMPNINLESFILAYNPAALLLVSRIQQLMERKVLLELKRFREKLLKAEKKNKK
jgi:hypothetical protein